MKYLVSDIKTDIRFDSDDLKKAVGNRLHISLSDILSVAVYKKSVDARKKPKIYYNVTALVDVSAKVDVKRVEKAREFTESVCYPLQEIFDKKSDLRPVVIGSGPAGTFAALALSRHGLRPIVVEKGGAVEDRIRAVERFWKYGILDKNCNVQFGEGGAGTFSDGKLTTGTKDDYQRAVLKEYVRFGAPEDILERAKPHMGTDNLVRIAVSARHEIERLGGEYMFDTEFTEPVIENGKVVSVKLKQKGVEFDIPCKALFLAIGHSSRETTKKLFEKRLMMTPKAFSVGFRIEHRQRDIDFAMYGEDSRVLGLPPAEYQLAVQTSTNRGVYTFCMCPGGKVVAAASEEGTVVTNGMSCFARDGENANSAVLSSVTEKDFSGLFGGMEMVQNIERKAYQKTGGVRAPSEYVGSYLGGRVSKNRVFPTYLPGTVDTNLSGLLPGFADDAIREALPLMDKKLHGFADGGAILTGVETRSSSPVRILRDPDSGQSNISGIYPIGEGAGYSGGIMTSAVDGLRAVEKYLRDI